jgi:dTDP-4-dehydrorhamnose 3,5-epimerase
MTFTPTPLEGSYLIQPDRFIDERGWFSRTFDKAGFEAINHTQEWVQMNHSFTLTKGTIRGMHYQEPPHGEIKLVRCISGKVYDVIVDIRRNSPTFLQSFGTELSADLLNMIYIPKGFAHGFQALTDGCELIYCHSAFYTQKGENGMAYNDPLISISWPLAVSVLSDRDKQHAFITEQFKGI